MQEDYQKIDLEIEPFKVNGKVTRESKFDWLEFKNILKKGEGIYVSSYALIYPKGMSEKEVSQRYFKYEKMLEGYLSGKRKVELGNMGVKKIINEINAEEIPF